MGSKFNIVYRSGRFNALGSEIVVALIREHQAGPGLHPVVAEWHPEFHHGGEMVYPERLSTLILFPEERGIPDAIQLANTWDELEFVERATA